MDFTTWQKIRIRDRLNEYRMEERGDLEKLPIATLQERLKEFATPESRTITMQTTWHVKDEALRRFAVGPKNLLDDEPLMIIKNFLIDEGYLLEDELEHQSEKVADLFRTQRLLANKSENARKRLALLAEGFYVAKPLPGDHSRNVELEITHEPGECFCHVTEHDYLIKHPPSRMLDLYNKRPRILPKTVRKGFGFLATDRNLLHIFLVGIAGGGHVHYVEVAGLGGQQNPHLLRIGGHNLMLPINPLTPKQLSACNIFSYNHKGNEGAASASEWEQLALGSSHDDIDKPIKRLPEVQIQLHRDEPQTPAVVNLGLIHAARGVSEGLVQSILARGGNPNFQDDDGMTALHHAASVGSRAGIRALVNSGKCDYLIDDNHGRSAAQLASEVAEDFAVARLLTKNRVAQARALGVSPWRR